MADHMQIRRFCAWCRLLSALTADSGSALMPGCGSVYGGALAGYDYPALAWDTQSL